MTLLCALVLWGEPLRVEGDPDRVDVEATVRAVEVRLGPQAEGWRIEVVRLGRERAHLVLHPPEGSPYVRDIALDGSSESASITLELASAITLLIENYEPGTAVTESSPTNPARRAARPWAWLASSGAVAINFAKPLAPRGFVGGVAGWLPRVTWVQPIAELGWLGVRGDGLKVDGVRAAVGVRLGAALAGDRVWLGGGVVPAMIWLKVRDVGQATQLAGELRFPAVVQVRPRWGFAELAVAPTWSFPPLRLVGAQSQVRWRATGVVFAVRVGATLRRLRSVD